MPVRISRHQVDDTGGLQQSATGIPIVISNGMLCRRGREGLDLIQIGLIIVRPSDKGGLTCGHKRPLV